MAELTAGRTFPLRIPSARALRIYVVAAVLLTLEFVLVYGFCNWRASQRTEFYHFFFEWERQAPFVPWMIYVYFSLNALTSLTAFVLDEETLVSYCKAIGLSILIAGIFFLLFPAEMGIQRPASVPGYEGPFGLLHGLDHPHNLVPSLHVTFSALSVFFMSPRRPAWFQGILVAWLALICAAVVLTHQHHLADIVGGFALAAFCHSRFGRGAFSR
ncbi:MAG TPA: phosphatase PAP2 family protein [Bdellovibrionota bacterium]|nr:phosphatase PAP2 family protein [Bdellovibrionota bacterium]